MLCNSIQHNTLQYIATQCTNKITKNMEQLKTKNFTLHNTSLSLDRYKYTLFHNIVTIMCDFIFVFMSLNSGKSYLKQLIYRRQNLAPLLSIKIYFLVIFLFNFLLIFLLSYFRFIVYFLF